MSTTDKRAIVQLVLTRNDMQNLAFLKLGENTKFVLGLAYDIQMVFEQQKNHLRSVTCYRRLPHPPPPSAEKVTFSSVFFVEPFPNRWSVITTILVILRRNFLFVRLTLGSTNKRRGDR